MKKASSNGSCQSAGRQDCDSVATSSAADLSETSPTVDPQPSTSRSSIENDEPDRRLRKRRIDLNRLPSNITCPQVCKFQHCGIQLRDGDQLEWHYQGHIAQEIEKLKKIRIKKPATHQTLVDDVRSRRRVRNSAFEKIRFHREKRLALARSSTTATSTASTPRLLECPVCGRSNVNEDELQRHVEDCLKTAPPPPEDPDDFESDVDPEAENLDVDSVDGFETYTWAGQTRIRATSLVEGGLRGAGFLTITRGDEDAELDIENVDDEIVAGAPQYTEDDVILSTSENDTATTSTQSDANRLSNDEPDTSSVENAVFQSTSDDDFSTKESTSSAPDLSNADLQALVAKLTRENEELKRQIVCKICMDPVYNRPLVSLVCWHVHCEECWLRSLGAKKLCPQCKVIIQPKDLRRVYL